MPSVSKSTGLVRGKVRMQTWAFLTPELQYLGLHGDRLKALGAPVLLVSFLPLCIGLCYNYLFPARRACWSHCILSNHQEDQFLWSGSAKADPKRRKCASVWGRALRRYWEGSGISRADEEKNPGTTMIASEPQLQSDHVEISGV